MTHNRKLILLSILIWIAVFPVYSYDFDSITNGSKKEAAKQEVDGTVDYAGDIWKEQIDLYKQTSNPDEINLPACRMIKDDNARNECESSIRAATTGNESYCNQIKDMDGRNSCMANIKNNESLCSAIRDLDTRTDCIAGIRQDAGLCYSIKNRDDQIACIASIQQQKGMCYSITNKDAQWGCLAGFSK